MNRTGFRRLVSLGLSMMMLLGDLGIPAAAEETAACSHEVVSFRTEPGTAATCTAEGSYSVTEVCETCGLELSRETVTEPAAGHSYQETCRTEADGDTAGSVEYTCTACGDRISVPLAEPEEKTDEPDKEPEETPGEGTEGKPEENDGKGAEAESGTPTEETPDAEPQQEPNGEPDGTAEGIEKNSKEEPQEEPEEKSEEEEPAGELPEEQQEAPEDASAEEAGTENGNDPEGTRDPETPDGEPQDEADHEPEGTPAETPAETTEGIPEGTSETEPKEEPGEEPAGENLEEPKEPENPEDSSAGESGEETGDTPEITGEAQDETPSDPQEQPETENTAAPAFEQQETVEGVHFTVKADPGVFAPETRLAIEKTGNKDFAQAVETVLGLHGDPEDGRMVRHRIYRIAGPDPNGTAKVILTGLDFMNLQEKYPEGEIQSFVMRWFPEKEKAEEQAVRIPCTAFPEENKLVFNMQAPGLLDVVTVITPAGEAEDEAPAEKEPEEEPAENEPAGEELSDEEPTGEEPAGDETEKELNKEEPAGEESTDEEPAKDESAGEELSDEEPAKEEPSGDEAEEELNKEEPASEGAADEEPAKDESAGGELSDEEPVENEPADDKDEEDLTKEQPAGEESTDEEPEKAEPAGDEAEEELNKEEPAGEEATDEEPAKGESSGDEDKEEITKEEPSDEEPADKEATDEEPAKDGPAGDENEEELTGEEPSGEEPADEEATDDEPADDESASEETEEELTQEGPAGEKPADEKAADEKPAEDEPAEDEPAGENLPEGEQPGLEGISEENNTEAAEEEEAPAFAEQKTVAGVIVTVEAEPGTFPKGAVLSVRQVPVYRERKADEAIGEIRDEEQTVVVSYTFDIQVLDAEGNEIQPAEGKKVSVTFALAETADENLETNVYHVTEEESGALTAEKLDAEVDAKAETVTALTDGFSLYTVEFTYNSLQYVLEGGAVVPLSEILASTGLSGTAEAVSVSNPELFSASDESGEWIVYSHRAFTTEEWMKVTIAGVAYMITVTDDTVISVSDFNGFKTAITTADAIVKLTADIKVPDRQAAIELKQSVTLDLNGHTLYQNANIEKMEFTLGIGNGTLTIRDSSSAQTGKITQMYALLAAKSGTIVLESGTLENLLSSVGGAVCLTDGGTFVMNGGTIHECVAIGGGGAVAVGSRSTFTMNGGALTGSASTGGGAVMVYGGTFVMKGGAITGNGAVSNGGGIYLEGGSVTISGGEISGNSVREESGGAIYVKAGTLNIQGGTFSNNAAGRYPGTDERANGTDGGAIMMDGGNLSITGGTFTGNFADNNGGALRIGSSARGDISNVTISGSYVVENEDDKGFGGAIYNEGTLTLTNVRIRNCTATHDGGAICNRSSGDLTIENCEISGNKVEYPKKPSNSYGGGGIFNQGTLVVQNKTVIRDNTANDNGGGIWNSGNVRLRDATLSGNTARGGLGGGVYNRGTVRCAGATTVEGNHAASTGGGIRLMEKSWLFVEGEPIIRNNTRGSSKTVSNVHIPTLNEKIIVTDRLTEKARIGVTYTGSAPTYTIPVILTSHLNQSGYGDETNFTSDNPVYWINLYESEAALWPCTLIHDPGDPNTSGSMPPVTINTTTVILPVCKFTHNQGRAFLGWMVDGDAENLKQPGTSMDVKGNITLTAIWETPWRSLQKNIDAAANGGTVTIGVDTTAETNDVALVIPAGKSLVLDLNGFTLDRNLKKAAENGSVIRILGGAALTIQDTRGTGLIRGGFAAGETTGGGISLEGGTLVLRGGAVRGNKSRAAGGKDIYLSESQSVTLSGKVTLGDLHFSKENSIILTGALDPASSIGVHFDWADGFPKYITSGFASQADRVSLARCFSSRQVAYGIGVDATDAAHPEAYIDTAVTVVFEEIDNMPPVKLARGSSFTIPVCDKANRPGTLTNGYWKDKKDPATTYYTENPENPTPVTIQVREDLTLTAVWDMTWATLNQTIRNAGNTPTTIRLNGKLKAAKSDVELTVASGQDITIDLNGYTLDRDAYGVGKMQGHVFLVSSGGRLTLTDSRGGGKITGGCSKDPAAPGGGIYIAGGATVIMTGGTITGNSSYKNSKGEDIHHGGGVYVATGGTFILNGPVRITKNENSAGKADNVYLKKTSATDPNDTLIQTGFSFQGATVGITSSILPSDAEPIVYLTRGLDFAEGDYTCFTSDAAVYGIGEGEGGEAILGRLAYVYLLDEKDAIRVSKTTAIGGVYTLAESPFVSGDGKPFRGWQRVEKTGSGYVAAGGGGLLVPGEKITANVNKIYLRAVFGEGIKYVDQNDTPLFREAGSYRDLKDIPDSNDADANAQVILEAGWYAVTENLKYEHRLQVRGEVNLILGDGATLTAGKGINLPEGAALHLWWQAGHSGALTATTSVLDHAAIGGNYFEAGGTYVQHGGIVTATASRNGAGVGGGFGRNAGNITIYNGTLNATGGQYAAGIGAGVSASQSASGGGAIVIWGGTVNATGGSRAAGIGGGQRFDNQHGQVTGGDGGPVSIWGGNVRARGGTMAAGIGGGVSGHGGRVMIGGGAVVEAIAGDTDSGAQAIGRGGDAEKANQKSGDHETLKEGDLRLASTCMVIAGETRADAEQVTETAKRVPACRLPYAKITSGRIAQYQIAVTPNAHATVYVYKASWNGTDYVADLNEEITTADAGQLFAVEIETDDESWLENDSVRATYLYSGEQDVPVKSRRTDRQDGTKARKVTIFYEMPRGDVVIAANPKVTAYEILFPSGAALEHGTLAILVDGLEQVPETAGGNQLRVYAHKGDAVTIQVDIPEENDNYFIDTISIRDKNQKDIPKTMGQTEALWVFDMPASDVAINVNLAEGIHYIDAKGIKQVRRHYFTIAGNDDMKAINYTINDMDGEEDGWYTFKGNGEIVIDEIVYIKRNARFILQDGQKVTFKKGIVVYRKDGGTLQIFAQHIDLKADNNMGTLTATGRNENHAGIGGIGSTPSGAITINGGNIIASGGDDGPGIGAGDSSWHEPIVIRNARVTATGGEDGAGIGSGKHGTSGEITIFSGIVYAKGGKYGAGIGSGNDNGKQEGTITIHDGTVRAYGGEDAAAIGAGKESTATTGTVIINGGNIYCESFDGGAGIGSGSNRDAGTVTSNGGEIEIYSREDGAGIGGGNKGKGGTVTINGGKIKIRSRDGACIGGGNKGAGGHVTINGGTLYLNIDNPDSPLLIGHGTDAVKEGRGSLFIYHSAMIVSRKDITLFDENTSYDSGDILRGEKRQKYFGYDEHVLIQPCFHPDCSFREKDHDVHTILCEACIADKPIEEAHVFDSDHDPDCDRCGYSRQRELVLRNNMLAASRNIRLYESDGETEVPDATKCVIGVKYRLQIELADGYMLSDVTGAYTKNSAQYMIQDLDVFSRDDRTVIYEFTMPVSDKNTETVVSLWFEKIEYRIIVDPDLTGGTVSLHKDTATVDDFIQFRLVPDDDRLRGEVCIERTDTDTVLYQGVPASNTVAFTMPASNVQITVQFRKKPEVFWVHQGTDGSWPATNTVDGTTIRKADTRPEDISYYVYNHTNPEEFESRPSYSFGYQADPSRRKRVAGYSIELEGAYRSDVPENDRNLYIYFSRKQYSLTFYADIAGTRINQSVLLRVGEPVRNAVRRVSDSFRAPTGYYLAGWTDSPRNTEYTYTETREWTSLFAATDTDTMGTAPRSLYPVLVRNRIKVSLKGGMTGAGNEIPLQGDATITSPDAAFLDAGQKTQFNIDGTEKIDMTRMNQAWRPGYGLKGWYTQNGIEWTPEMLVSLLNCDRDPETGKPVIREEERNQANTTGKISYYTLTLTAAWDLRKAKVVYDLGGTALAPGSASVPAESALVPLKDKVDLPYCELTPSDDTLEFAGWQDLNGILYRGPSADGAKDGDSIPYRETNLSGYGTGAYTFGANPEGNPNTIQLTAVFEKKGTGDGWIAFNTGTDATQIRQLKIALPNSQPVTLDLNYNPGGSEFWFSTVGNPLAGDPYQEIAKLPIPARRHCIFVNWVDNAGTNVIKQVTVENGQTIQLYAQWEQRKYQLTYDTNGGPKANTPANNNEYAFEEPIIQPANYPYVWKDVNGEPVQVRQTKENGHYTFEEWEPALPEKMRGEDLTVHAVWTPTNYLYDYI